MIKIIFKTFSIAFLVLHFVSSIEAIIKGVPTSIANYPFTVAVKNIASSGAETFGTGSLVTNKCILTNFHVVNNARYLQVCGGSDVLLSGICKWVVKYMSFGSTQIDIAVLVLGEPLTGPNISTVELDFTAYGTDTWLKATGYSVDPNGDPNQRVMSYADFQVEPWERCDDAAMFCFRDRNLQQLYQPGDSGGPVLKGSKQIAVASGIIYVNGVLRNLSGVPFSNPTVAAFLQNEIANNCY